MDGVQHMVHKLHAEKTQLMWLGTQQQMAKLTVTQLQLINLVVEFDNTATDLGEREREREIYLP